MGPTVQGVFRILDQASPSLDKIMVKAKGTDKAISGVGSTLDKVAAQAKADTKVMKDGIEGVGKQTDETTTNATISWKEFQKQVSSATRGMTTDAAKLKAALKAVEGKYNIDITGKGDIIESTQLARQLKRELDAVQRQQAKTVAGQLGLAAASAGGGGKKGIFSRLGDAATPFGTMPSLAAAAISPVVDLTGAVGALAGSLGQAAIGAGALAIGGAGIVGTGLAGIVAIAIPAVSSIKKLYKAQTSYNTAVATYGKNSSQAATAAKKLLAVQKESPNMHGFNPQQFKTLGKEWRKDTKAGQGDFFATLEFGIKKARDLMPSFAASANKSMKSARGGVELFLNRLDGPEFKHFLSTMSNSFEKDVKPMASTLANIGEVFGRISVAAAPRVDEMVKTLEHGTEMWVKNTGNAKELKTEISQMVSQTKDWGRFLKSGWNLLKDTLGAGAGQGQGMVRGMTKQFKEWDHWIGSNQEKVKGFFANSREGVGTFFKMIGSFIPTLTNFYTAFRPISTVIETAVTALNSVKIGNITAMTGILGVVTAKRIKNSLFGGGGNIMGSRGPAAPGSLANPIAVTGLGVGGEPIPGKGGGSSMLSKAAKYFPSVGGGALGLTGPAAIFAGSVALGEWSNTRQGEEALGAKSPQEERHGRLERYRGHRFANRLARHAARDPFAVNPLTGGNYGWPSANKIFESEYTRHHAGPATMGPPTPPDIAKKLSKQLPGKTEGKHAGASLTEGIGQGIRENQDKAVKPAEDTRNQVVRQTTKMAQEAGKSVESLGSTFGTTMKYINETTNQGLSALGVKSVGWTVMGIPGAKGPPAPHTGGGAKKGSGKHTLGGSSGFIPGRGKADTVPVPGGMAAPGEAWIANEHTQNRLDRYLRPFHTSLAREINREGRPHNVPAPTGTEGPILPGKTLGGKARFFARGGKASTTSAGGMGAVLAEMNRINAQHFPYSWGGGHGGFTGPYDCSGAVSAALHAGGYLSTPETSGSLAGWGQPGGSSGITVYANPEHAFMSYNGKFWGTSLTNPGGGAGWIPASNFSSSYLAGFTKRHPAGSTGSGGGFSLTGGGGGINIPQVGKLTLKGPKSAMAGIAQGNINKTRDAANKLLMKKGGAGAGGMVGRGGGQTIRGKVSWFNGGNTAGGKTTSDPGIAVNLHPGSESGWDNSTTQGWMKQSNAGHPVNARVNIAGHSAMLPIIDLGPAGFTQRAIDVTEGGVRKLGFSTGAFPTDAMGMAQVMTRGGRAKWGGWHARGGTFKVNKPTVFGAGEAGEETVHISRGGDTRKGDIHVHIANIENHRKGDIKRMLEEEFDKLGEDVTFAGSDHD